MGLMHALHAATPAVQKAALPPRRRPDGLDALTPGSSRFCACGRIVMKLHLRDRVRAAVLAYESGLVAPGNEW